MPDLSDKDFLDALSTPKTSAVLANELGGGSESLAAGAAIVPQPSRAGISAPSIPDLAAENLRKQGAQPDIPFHEEGMDFWTTLMGKARETKEAQLRYLAKRFGPENVRLNELDEPVVRITNPDTGKAEDFPLNAKKMTLNNLASLARFAPEIAGSALALQLGGPSRGVLMRSLLGALGSEEGATLKDIALSGTDARQSAIEHLQNVPGDMLADLGLAGLLKSGQIAKGIIQGKGIPNPLAGHPILSPADPELTSEGVAAALRNQARSGIAPNLRPSEVSGIPFMAMLEQYMERKPAGTKPMLAGKIRREEASTAFQNWMIDPATLPTDEEVGRKGLSLLEGTVEPLRKDVALAEFGVQAEQKGAERIAETLKNKAEAQIIADQRAKVLSGLRATTVPTQGVPLSETGDLLRSRFIELRNQFKAQSSDLYNKFFENPKAKEPLISGNALKRSIDDLRMELPAVTKEVEKDTGLLSATGEPITTTQNQKVPISTPIRSRLDELSSKLEDGKVSINDLKQIRTDLDDAIKIGEAIPGVKEGRLKSTYKAVSDAITDGLRQINDPELTQAWKDATKFYRENVDRFTEKNVSRLAREAEDTSAVGNAEFVKKAIGSEDAYQALRGFYGLRSTEMGAFRNTVRNKVLADSLGVGDLVDGQNLVRALRGLRDSNPELYKDVFAGRGNDFLRAAEQLGSFQQKIPVEEIEKLLTTSRTGDPSIKLLYLQNAQRRLNEEYQNSVVNKFLKGDIPASKLEPDKFVSSLPQAKLSDVRDVMSRIEREDPAVAEQIRRKSVQNLLSEARRNPQPRDTMAKLTGESGDLISGTGISNALGRGDQLEKYKALLGNLYEPLTDYAKTELLGEERRRVAGGVGMLAPGSAMNAFIKALTPWEGGHKPEGIIKEMSGLARDKVLSIALSSNAVRNWLVSPHSISEIPNAIKLAILSQPFLEGAMQEFKSEGELQKVMSILKVAFGTADRTKGEHKRELSDQEFQNAITQP